ncbi:hypothetical protein [Luteibacter sp. 9135]|uniref:hypothetical protein n=1 Tax=Luteibacter sp. 9135 TaxID=1500893 RepID=UPI0006903833|nr:hypothetical protein [Luteibacter sp. 9135]
MAYSYRSARLSALVVLFVSSIASAQTSGGFKGFLQRTAGAVLGQTSGNGQAKAGNGPSVTDGPVYRPVSPASGGTFPGLFRGWSPMNNPGKFPRVSLFFESFGASAPCWRTRATIWTSDTKHYEEVFDLCNAPVETKDDLGATTTLRDPTTTYVGKLSRETFAPGISVTADRTVGPNPPRLPFLMDFGSAPNPQLRGQYQDIVVRAMVISGYATSPQEPLFWVGGFAPDGNRDQRAR